MLIALGSKAVNLQFLRTQTHSGDAWLRGPYGVHGAIVTESYRVIRDRYGMEENIL